VAGWASAPGPRTQRTAAHLVVGGRLQRRRIPVSCINFELDWLVIAMINADTVYKVSICPPPPHVEKCQLAGPTTRFPSGQSGGVLVKESDIKRVLAGLALHICLHF
jgi:hypothetical protein